MIDTLQKLHVQGLQAIYDAELQAIEGAPKIHESISSPELRQTLDQNLESTRQLIPRLEQALQQAGATTERVPNPIMQGILTVGSRIQNETSEPAVRDAGIIAGAQIGMHYFIAAYGTMRAYAETLGNREVAELSEQLVQQRKQQDEQLSQIAEGIVNKQAQAAGQ